MLGALIVAAVGLFVLMAIAVSVWDTWNSARCRRRDTAARADQEREIAVILADRAEAERRFEERSTALRRIEAKHHELGRLHLQATTMLRQIQPPRAPATIVLPPMNAYAAPVIDITPEPSYDD